jgi:uncharacterized protein YeeX (DUF496 family)
MKNLKIRKLRPQFTTVITTLNVYEDNLIEDGVVIAPKGALKLYQTVVAVGPNVREIKEGDLVLLNLQNYIKRKYKNNSIKEDISEMEEEYVYDFPKMFINGEILGKFQDRDIDGVIEDFEEIEITDNKQNTFFN